MMTSKEAMVSFRMGGSCWGIDFALDNDDGTMN